MGLNFGGALFPPRGEFITTFDFTDIATGLGIENFWGTPVVDNSGTDFTLLPTQEHSGNGDENTIQSGEGTTTLNFNSSTFNLPRTAKGIAYVSFGGKSGNASATSFSAQIAVVDSGGTPTNISSVIESPQIAGANFLVSSLLALPLTQTGIKKGEKLRLIIKIIVDATAGTGTLLHDNTNSDTQNQLKLLMPFRIET